MNYLEKARAVVARHEGDLVPPSPREEPPAADAPPAPSLPPCEHPAPYPCSEVGKGNSYCRRFCRPAHERAALRLVKGGKP